MIIKKRTYVLKYRKINEIRDIFRKFTLNYQSHDILHYKYEQNQLLPSMNILLKMKDIYKCDYEELVNAYRMAKGVYDERKAKKRSKSAN